MTATHELLCLVLLVAGTKGDVFDYNFKALSSPRTLSDAIESLLLRNKTEVSWNCSVQLSDYVTGLRSREEWALMMYDSTGKLPAGILDGNFAEMGSFDQCLYVTKLNAEPESSSFTGQYCMGSIFINVTRNISGEILISRPLDKLSFSTCLPDGCSGTDVQNLIKSIGINLTTNHCQTLSERPELDTEGITGLTIFVCLALLMVASTIYDLRNQFIKKRAPNALLSAFSVYTNLKKIFKMKSAPGEILCLHGVRSIAMVTVIAVHRFNNSVSNEHKNNFYKSHWLFQIENMPLVKGEFSLDVFFFLSGSMITYGYFQKMTKQQKFRIILYYVNRYLRLTPPLAAVILFIVSVTKYLGSGPLWPEYNKSAIDPCVHNWWANMLYIQTFVFPMCLPHTWYLAVDTQLFFLSPLILIPLRRWPKKVLVATAFLTACCIAAVFAIAWIMEFRVTLFFNGLNYWPYTINFFSPSPSRALPWLIGMIFGYFLHISNKSQDPIRKPIAQQLLFVALVICFAVVFGAGAILNSKYNQWISSFYMALSTPALILSLAWIIYCCKLGYAGPINSFLSCPPFKIVSKLTYCIYLVHLPLINYSIYTMRVAHFLTDFERTVHQIPGDLLYSFLIALVLSVSVELPTQTFMNALLKKL